jgi:hypothetical protein
MNRVERSALILGERLGQGGQGSVYPVLGHRAAGSWDAVYKEYRADVLGRVDVAALEALGDLAAALPEADRGWLAERTAWPTDLVVDGGAVIGFLMRAVPAEFYFALKTLTSNAKLRLAQVEFLLNADDYVAGIGLTVSESDRLALLADLAATLVRLHALGIAVGDLSPKNLLFSAGPRPRCFLIDCDAMRVAGTSVLPQVETTEWQLPDGEELATARGDAYKFGLLAARLFSRDQSSRDVGPLLDVSPTLGELAHLSQQEDTAGRLDLATWSPALALALRSASTDPAQTAVIEPRHPVAAVAPRTPPASRPAPSSRRIGALVIGAAAILTVILAWTANGCGGRSQDSSSRLGGDGGYSSPYTTAPPAGSGSGGSGSGSGAGSGGAGYGNSPSPPGAATDEQRQLQAVQGILSDASSVRSQVSSTVADVDGCNEAASTGRGTLLRAANSRSLDAADARALALDAVPGGSGLQSTLIGFLDDSARADNAYAAWAADVGNAGCPLDAASDQNYQDGDAASRDATAEKQTFVSLWDPLARAFGLTAYSADEL